jgi:hypothetical protein
MVFDPVRGKLVVMGGQDSIDSKDTAFSYDGSLAALPAIPHVANNGGSTAAYDFVTQQVLIASGNGLITATGADELYALKSAASSWTGVCSSCGAWRKANAIIYDPVLRRLILVGGTNMTDAVVDGTWALGPSGYTQVDTSPPGRGYPTLVYDGGRDTIVMYGGYSTLCPGNGNCGDTWEMVPN